MNVPGLSAEFAMQHRGRHARARACHKALSSNRLLPKLSRSIAFCMTSLREPVRRPHGGSLQIWLYGREWRGDTGGGGGGGYGDLHSGPCNKATKKQRCVVSGHPGAYIPAVPMTEETKSPPQAGTTLRVNENPRRDNFPGWVAAVRQRTEQEITR